MFSTYDKEEIFTLECCDPSPLLALTFFLFPCAILKTLLLFFEIKFCQSQVQRKGDKPEGTDLYLPWISTEELDGCEISSLLQIELNIYVIQ